MQQKTYTDAELRKLALTMRNMLNGLSMQQIVVVVRQFSKMLEESPVQFCSDDDHTPD